MKGECPLPGTSIPISQVTGAPQPRAIIARAARLLRECIFGILAVAATGALAHDFSWLSSLGLLPYVPAVALIALLGGGWSAVVAALAVLPTQAAFSPEHVRWSFAAAPGEAVALILLVSIALFVYRLARRAEVENRGVEALGRQLTALFDCTRRTLQMDLHTEPGQQLAELVCESFDVEAAVIYDADLHTVYQAGAWHDDPKELVQNVYHFTTSDDDQRLGLSRRVVRLGAVPVGSIVLRGDVAPVTASFIASLVAITFDRYRALVNESRIEAERRAEQLRSAVLDGLAHAYKTPLTAIRAASTGLIEMGGLRQGQFELASLITEQSSLLDSLTSRLLTTARLDTDKVTVNPSIVSVAPIIEEALACLGDRRTAASVHVELPDDTLQLCCDRRLLVMLLSQYLDNACKYSTGREISLRAAREEGNVIFSVHSFGPVIPAEDRERIFDRYYRSATASTLADGTGIGLSVAKRAAAAHGGSVWVSSDENAGTTFYAAIPATVVEIAS